MLDDEWDVHKEPIVYNIEIQVFIPFGSWWSIIRISTEELEKNVNKLFSEIIMIFWSLKTRKIIHCALGNKKRKGIS